MQTGSGPRATSSWCLSEPALVLVWLSNLISRQPAKDRASINAASQGSYVTCAIPSDSFSPLPHATPNLFLLATKTDTVSPHTLHVLAGHCQGRVDPLRRGRVLGHLDPDGTGFPCLLASLPHGTDFVGNLQLQKRLSSALVGDSGSGHLQSTFLLLAMVQSAFN